MKELFQQLMGAWKALSLKQRTTLVISAALTIGAVAAIVFWAKQPTWAVLYTGLDNKDAQAVIQELQSRKVPFKLREGGGGVEVPMEQVDKLRLQLAEKSLPGSGRFGFLEMFAQDTIAQSDKAQKMRYQKALEDELARTIESLDEVRQARVHLVLPGDRLFLDDQDQSKASVTLTLNRGKLPTPEEVRSIVFIVSGGVQGLAPERVSVVDTAGHTLWEGDGTTGSVLTARQQELKGGVEKDINSKVARVLEPLVGSTHFVVRTSADLDFQKVHRKERLLDPESGALVSEQKTKERSSGGTAAMGIPGTGSNLPGGAAPAIGGDGGSTSSDSVTNNFEYSVVEKTVEEPIGNVNRLSVAVLLDYAKPAGGGGAGGQNAPGSPRSAEDVRRIEQLVKAAISFNEDRGDVVTVEQAPFAVPEEMPAPGFDWRSLLPYLKYPALVLLLLLVFFLFYKPFVRTAREGLVRGREPARPGAVGTAEVERPALLGPSSQVELLRQRLGRLAAEQPQGMAQTVRVWLNEPKES